MNSEALAKQSIHRFTSFDKTKTVKTFQKLYNIEAG